ncbi:MAG: hypothetical protein ACLGGX_09300, partial [Bdellovibrionia bacterium]
MKATLQWYCYILVSFIFTAQASAQITLAELESIKQAFYAEYGPEITRSGGRLSINKAPDSMPLIWWETPYVNASYVTRLENGVREHNLYVMGGYARLPGMTVDGVIGVLCHELAHGIGGAPHKLREPDQFGEVSTEAQSDYWGYGQCLPRMFKRIPPQKSPQAATPQIDRICQRRSGPVVDINTCYRFFDVMEIERDYFANHIVHRGLTDFETPDRTIADRVNLEPDYYPSLQCRIDTMIEAFFQNPRP